MLFNSLPFIWFFPLVFLLYWFVFSKKLAWQNTLLLVASYYFYACWDFRFLFLLMFSTMLDYYSGIMMSRAETASQKKTWFWISVVVNVGFLGVFKYYDFFVTSFSEMLGHLGWQVHPSTINLILPVGISFYTFHGLSYVIDVYKDRIKPEYNFVTYGVFVSYFPLLVAGPIERATHLLPQIKIPRAFTYAQGIVGLRLLLFGFFKKVVIADSLAGPTNEIFATYQDQTGSNLLIGAVFFAIQIYCDFSGYSDIAMGASRLLGIELIRNFNFPYFSKSIGEFWRKWHISLSSWFKDYLYIPLGGSKGGMIQSIRNVLIVFLVSGFWHGANWTFVVWGAIHAFYFIPGFVIRKKSPKPIGETAKESSLTLIGNSLKVMGQMLFTFTIVCFAWIFFRAESLGKAIAYIERISLDSLTLTPGRLKFLIIFLVVELLIFYFNHLEGEQWYKRLIRLSVYCYLFITVISNSTRMGSNFIYFQF